MVAGDSKVTIDWINSKSNLNLNYFNEWKDKIKDGTQRQSMMDFYEEIVEEAVANTLNFYIFYCVTIHIQLYEKSSICH
jgi:hypothetical protein